MRRFAPYIAAAVIIALFAVVVRVTWINPSWWIRRAVAKWNGSIEPLEDEGDHLVSIKQSAWRLTYLQERPLKSLRTLYDLGTLPDQA